MKTQNCIHGKPATEPCEDCVKMIRMFEFIRRQADLQLPDGLNGAS